MFERRLKIFLFFLILAAMVLALRAAQIQILQQQRWRDKAADMMKRQKLIETTRGQIWDRDHHHVLAYDAPCVDASVDYRAIGEDPDPDYLAQHANENLRARLGKAYQPRTDEGKAEQAAEIEQIKSDLNQMWAQLAQLGGKSPEEIMDIRRNIVARVEMRKRFRWWHNYELANASAEKQSTSWYEHFLSDTGPTEDDIDKYESKLGEETEPQVILNDVSPSVQAALARQQSRFFCLSLVPSKVRKYPYNEVACHLIGYLGSVREEEMKQDPYGSDELRRYWTNDLVGRAGAEAACERTLRGIRGSIERNTASDEILSQTDAAPGADVDLSIDIDLQKDMEADFAKPRHHVDRDTHIEEVRADQHGAAVVLDLKTNQVLAAVSYPNFDLNTVDKEYSALSRDDLNLPLLNRATQMAVEPGSTVKPIVGLGSITDGIMTPASTIQCKGDLVIDGKKQPHGHCWTYNLWLTHRDVAAYPSHNSFPGFGPPLPNDMLTVSDGLERSCNVVFETIADRLGMSRLSFWYRNFGLGSPTGIGIEESPGRLFRPGEDDKNVAQRVLSWSAGIGEGVVHATPLQMANVAATVARDGIWMRPELIPSRDLPDLRSTQDLIDLHLSPDAIAAVKKGMYEVVNGNAATGYGILPEKQEPPLADDPLENIRIAGKTGTAQTSPLSVPLRNENGDFIDAQGNIIKDGEKLQYIRVDIGTPGTQSWYMSADQHYQHAWFIGYAPADHPQVAFCVMVEYGEAGGRVAGAIAHDLLVDCVKHGYLSAQAGHG